MELENEFRTDQPRMSGFLEKKGKMKLMTPWRKYWFVLEERLLLYYRSEIEYKKLSPCRGSLNMGLVTSVRPGSSTGPCIIQIVTRTQTVQLRAKNRATQEEWLHALLRSKALPFASQIARPPRFKPGFIGSTKSLESLSFDSMLKRIGLEKEYTLQRHLNHGSKNQISGSYYGGSLDTAIWSKKCRPFPSPSPNLPKGKMLEKILGFSKENDFHGFVDCPKKTSFHHLTNENEIKFLGKHVEEEEEGGGEERGSCKNVPLGRKCRVHDENRNHHSQVKEPCYEFLDRKNIKLHKTFSDPELNENKTFHYPENVKLEKKDVSAFDRIKSALSKTSKDKSLNINGGVVKVRATRKRRKSFLEKVFKRKGDEIYEYDSDITDPLYETINMKLENRRPLSRVVYNEEEKEEIVKDNVNGENREERVQEFANEIRDISSNSIPRKTLAGSKIILPAEAMSELKFNLKSQRHCENSDLLHLDNDEEVSRTLKQKVREGDKTDNMVPLLPPRRVSRPVSPWHDVPTNNAPINDNSKSFFVHQAVVKFKDHTFAPEIETPKMDDTSLNEDDGQDSLKPQENSPKEIKTASVSSQSKNDDLSLLLTQLTKITVAPLAEPEVDDSTSSESEKCCRKTQHADPDYDVPRPHKPLHILINPGSEIISSMQFMGRREENSDTSSSFQSIEPDSLEAAEKKIQSDVTSPSQ